MGEDRERAVEVRDSVGVVIGEGNTQINYTYNAFAVTGGVSPAPLVSVTGGVESPYRGLNAFEDGEEAFFFGRDAAAEEVLTRLADRPTPGIVMVSGASGVGKSSLMRAGVVPRLRAAAMTADEGPSLSPCLVITPTRTPLDELAVRVAPLVGTDAATIRRELSADPHGFALTARQAAEAFRVDARPAGAGRATAADSRDLRLVLVVDQFEELFMQCPDEAEDERRAFITALHSAATATGAGGAPVALVVLVVRADFEARCARYELLADAVQGRYMLMPMTSRQLRLAITEPASIVGSHIDDGLVSQLMAEARSQAAALPLLSYALDQAWRNKTGDTLRLADYERIGGMEGSVAASAGRAYATLTSAQQVVAQQVFMRLTVTNSEGQVSAARATRAELETGASAADVTAVLEAFADHNVRLVTIGADSVSISHEVLLTAWDQLREWLQGDLEDRIRYARVRADARTWDASKRANSYLYPAGRLAELRATERRWESLPGRYPPLDEVSAAFVSASKEDVRAAIRRRRAVMAVLVALAVGASTAAGFATFYAVSANRQHRIALSRQLAAESLSIDSSDAVRARQLALAAWRISPTSDATTAMTQLLVEQQENGELPASAGGNADSFAFSPDSRLLLTAGYNGGQLWDTASGQHVGEPMPGQTFVADGQASTYTVGTVAFSPDGTLVATGDVDGYIRLWDAASRKPIGQPIAAELDDTVTGGGVIALAFSPDGTVLASAGMDGSVKLWNVATRSPAGRPLPTSLSISGRGADYLAFRPDGKVLATASSGGYVRQWNLATGTEIGKALQAVANRKTDSVNAVTYSSDGTLLAAGSTDGTIRVWKSTPDRSAGITIAAVRGSRSGVNALAFSPDGRVLASADDDSIGLWNPRTGRPSHEPMQDGPENGSAVEAVQFSPDGRLLASGDGSGDVRLWDAATYSPVGKTESVPFGNRTVAAVIFGPRGRLATGPGSDGYVDLWESTAGGATSMRLPASVREHGRLLSGLTWPGTPTLSPDGALLASADDKGYVHVWSAITGKPVGKPITGDSSEYPFVVQVAFSPDGKVLAIAGKDGRIRIWNTATETLLGKPIPAAEQPVELDAIAFSPDGKLIASVDNLGYAQLWNVATGAPTGRAMSGDPGSSDPSLTDVVFSPDGKLLAAADMNGYIWLWDTASQALAAKMNSGSSLPGGPNSLAFSPDGTTLASANQDGYARLWNPATGTQDGVPVPTTDAGGPNGVSQVMFSPDGKVLVTVDSDGHVQPWEIWIFKDPAAALCADVGAPFPDEWAVDAPGEPEPTVCPAR